MRSQFIKSLMEIRSKSPSTMLLVADLGYSVIEPFVNEYPNEYLNVGVAEQNLATVAAGLASTGYLCFCYSIANFPTFRCAEQIRNDIDYHNLPVCITSVGGGLAYGNMGYSHHAIQDIGLMRLMPNMLICAPADPLECRLVMNLISERMGPAYLRLHKQGEPIITTSAEPIIPGLPRHCAGDPHSRKVILTTGYSAQGLYPLIECQEEWSLFTMPSWGMKYREPFLDWIKRHDRVHIVEDHYLDGGFCSWILESLIGTSHLMKITHTSLPASLNQIVAKESTFHEQAGLFEIPYD